MPHTHSVEFQVRHYECDIYGHLYNPNYLRYMQVAGTEASRRLGFDLEEYESRGRKWWIRRSQIEFLQPLRYADRVEIRTWVESVRRVQAHRRYEFHEVASGEVAARAGTDWVYLDAATGRPAVLTPDLVEALFPEGLPQAAAAAKAFPGLDSLAETAHTLHRRVEWRDLDPYGHVNNATYLDYMIDAAVRAAEAYGWGQERREREGLGFVVRKAWLEYHSPAALGEDLELMTWFSGVRRASGFRHYLIRRAADGDMVTGGTTYWASVHLDTGRPARMPASFHTDFGAHIAPE